MALPTSHFHTEQVSCLSLSDEDSLLVTGSMDNTIAVWKEVIPDVSEGNQRELWKVSAMLFVVDSTVCCMKLTSGAGFEVIPSSGYMASIFGGSKHQKNASRFLSFDFSVRGERLVPLT